MPKFRRTVRLQAARGPPGHTVFHLTVPAYIVKRVGLAKGDVLRVRTEGTRLIYERD